MNLERADNTARLWDLKCHGMEADIGPSRPESSRHTQEYYHWAALLRSDMPRSLHASMVEVMSNLKQVSNGHSGKIERHAGRLLADLQYTSIDETLSAGLQAFLTQFLERINALGIEVSKDFLMHQPLH